MSRTVSPFISEHPKPAMKAFLAAALVTICLASCSFYNPLNPKHGLYQGPLNAAPGRGVTVKFLGNTTIHIADGTTDLLVDGFFSRPGLVQTLLGKIAPDQKRIAEELDRAKISKVDALLVAHAHADHALDAPTLAKMKDALVMGNVSYRFIHEGEGARMDREHLFMVPCHGTQKQFGKFKVTFVPSEHVTARNFVQEKIEGHITTPLKTPAPFSSFKCGEVYAIHIEHPDGSVLITTSAGAASHELDGYRADVVFLGVGLLANETCCQHEHYWHETVRAVHPHTVVPVHWDNFSRKLSAGLKPAGWPLDNMRATMGWLQGKAKCQGCRLMLMGLRDSIRLQRGVIQ